MAKRPQHSVTLGRYHQFVIERIAERMDRSISQVIGSMVEQWVTDHQDVISDNEATVQNFLTWKRAQEGE